MKIVCRLQRARIFLATATTLAFTHAVAGQADLTPAVWKQQEIFFVYRPGASVHTCGGLRTQLRTLLTALGAHGATTITTVKCDDSASAHEVVIGIASPVEVTAAVPDSAAADSKAQLVARVRGEEVLGSAATFPARWTTISFANAMRLRLSPGDCELLRQLRRVVMPKLAVRVVRDRMRCGSDFGSGNRPQLVVAALVAAPEGAL